MDVILLPGKKKIFEPIPKQIIPKKEIMTEKKRLIEDIEPDVDTQELIFKVKKHTFK